MVIIDEHDIGKSRKEILMDLIYESTEKRIPLDKVRFGRPKEVDQRTDLEFDPNIFIPMQVDHDFDDRFTSKDFGVLYCRRDIGIHCRDLDVSAIIIEEIPFKVTDLLEQINDYLKFPIVSCEILDYEYTSVEQVQQYGIILQADSDSLLWRGSTTLFGVDTGNLDGTKTPLL